MFSSRPRLLLLRGCYSGRTCKFSRPVELLVLVVVLLVQCPTLSFAYTTPVGGVPARKTTTTTTTSAAPTRLITTTSGKTVMTINAQSGGRRGFVARRSMSHPFSTGRTTTTIRSMIEPSSSSSSSITDNNNNDNNSNGDNGDGDNNDIWYPRLRRFIGSIATVGAMDTAYLTYSKIIVSQSSSDGGILCGIDGDCNTVLNGPYSTLPYTDIPLAALGFVAYASVIALALGPLLLPQKQPPPQTSSSLSSSQPQQQLRSSPDAATTFTGAVTTTTTTTTTTMASSDSTNRQALAGLTILMGSFSICLMILLYGVLHLSCPYCVLSAGCSTLLAALTVIGKCWPETDQSIINNNNNNNNSGIRDWSLATVMGSSALTATAVAVLLYVGGSSSSILSLSSSEQSSSTTTDLMATMTMAPSTNPQQEPQQAKAPPPITTDSSDRAMRLTKDLVSLNAKMYGAYWCSHCYDQKMELGRQAFAQGNIPYIECSKDGLNAQVQLCTSQKLPGYPTWEINGEFFPGQQELDELEQIVQEQQTLNQYPPGSSTKK
jgi:uncharacterized membrane protein